MFEFINERGTVIDQNHPNIVLVHEIALGTPTDGHRSTKYGFGVLLWYDFAVPDTLITPIVGVTVFEGVGYNVLCYLDQNKSKRVRIWLGVDGDYIKNRHSKVTTNNPEEVVKQLGIKAHLYECTPRTSKANCGLEVYSADGRLIYDSDYRPLKIGINGDINNGKHIMFCPVFCHPDWIFSNAPLPRALNVNDTVFLWTYFAGMVQDYHYFAKSISASYGINAGLAINKWYLNHFPKAILGHL